jgi:hydroxypyruvate isomerase
MRRRQFFGACAGAGATVAAAATTAASAATSVSAATYLADSDAAQASTNAIPPFKLSVMLWTVYEKLPFDQRIEKVAEAGYNAVELVNEYKNFTKEDYAKFRAKKHELHLTVDATSGISHSLCDASQRDAFLDEVRAKLPVLEELECNKLIILSGDKVPGQTSEQMHDNCIESLKRAADIAAAKNVGLLLENIDPEENPKYFLTSVSEGFEIVRSVHAPNVQFLYDLFHDQIAEGNLLAKLEKNLDLIGVVHIADVPGRHDPGTGEINYPNIFRKLGQLGFNGYVAMEFIPEGETVAALRAAREMAMKYGSAQRNQSAQFISPGRPHATA